MVRILLEDTFGVGMNDVYADKVRQFSADELCEFHTMLQRLENGEPVQYVTGKAQFGELMLRVNPGRSALVLSHISASTPFLPISAKR